MSSRDLSGKRALVCGASKGIGRATALRLADQGADVTVLARSRDALGSLVDDIASKGRTARVLVADMDHRPGLEVAIDDHLEANGPIQILIHNTGGPPAGPLLAAREGDLLKAFGRHVLTAHLLVQKLLPGMKESGYGRIVNILSTSVREPIPNLGVSNTTRAAMAAWAKTLSRELPPGVTINSVLPGYTDTERLSELAGTLSAKTGRTEKDIQADWIDKTPEGRLGRPEELAGVIGFLCSEEAAFIRGTVVPVDGGRLQSI